jgi:hypothetical protein
MTSLFRHCERSEAIHLAESEKLDCFVVEPLIARAFARLVGSSQCRANKRTSN